MWSQLSTQFTEILEEEAAGEEAEAEEAVAEAEEDEGPEGMPDPESSVEGHAGDEEDDADADAAA